MAKSAVKMFAEHPFGVGWRGFPEVYSGYEISGTPLAGITGTEHRISESHSLPFTILAELGLQGIIVTFFLVLSLFRHIIASLKEGGRRESVFAAMAGTALAFLVDFCFYSDIFNNLFWIFLGLIFSQAGRKANGKEIKGAGAGSPLPEWN